MRKSSPADSFFIILAGAWIVALGILGWGGCSTQPPRVAAPEIDPAQVARRALELYDRDQDGLLAGEELSNGFREFVATADEDDDDKLSEAEIVKRLQEHVDDRVGLQDIGGIVSLNNRPLVGATVTFIPDAAFAGAITEASGVTDVAGFVQLRHADSDLPGVKPGLYRIEVRQSDQGRERIPGRFHEQSTLGIEVGLNVSQGGWKLDLRGN
jgi:hypothetical protein